MGVEIDAFKKGGIYERGFMKADDSKNATRTPTYDSLQCMRTINIRLLLHPIFNVQSHRPMSQYSVE